MGRLDMEDWHVGFEPTVDDDDTRRHQHVRDRTDSIHGQLRKIWGTEQWNGDEPDEPHNVRLLSSDHARAG